MYFKLLGVLLLKIDGWLTQIKKQFSKQLDLVEFYSIIIFEHAFHMLVIDTSKKKYDE